MDTLGSTPRAISVRLTTELQQRLLAASVATGLSVSQLLRQGAEQIVTQYLGGPDDVDAAVAAAERRTAARMRVLLGSPARGASYESTREMLSVLVAELSHRILAANVDDTERDALLRERDEVVQAQRTLDPTDPDAVDAIRNRYSTRASELRPAATAPGG